LFCCCFVVVVVGGGGGGGGGGVVVVVVVWWWCVESIVCLKIGGLFVGFVVHSAVPSVHHCQKWYLLQYGHRPYTVMTRSLGTSVISCTARAVFMLL